eukprot:CAMPEP_0182437150 /NCGR_PEP_ID=MMETSP1167-20130531/84841_1 /TAXON_ID=2988 /ORGANISM="Mallomonas Sp, Strain CCMP3275" /LENGTH=221 /DNA_ID=CAMNT_0024629955 /DNA_START=698 /DNA_END=1360 /DNA_ORIENTATION=-
MKIQEKEEEMSVIRGNMSIERMNHQNAMAMMLQGRASSLTQISRAIQREMSGQMKTHEQHTASALTTVETKLNRFQRKVFSFVSALRVQRKDRTQSEHITKLLHHHQIELNNTKQLNDEATVAIRELFEWLRSLRFTGASDYISVLDNENTGVSNGNLAGSLSTPPGVKKTPMGSTSGSALSPGSISSSKLPSLIRQARTQLQAVISAQQDLIQDQRRIVW